MGQNILKDNHMEEDIYLSFEFEKRLQLDSHR